METLRRIILLFTFEYVRNRTESIQLIFKEKLESSKAVDSRLLNTVIDKKLILKQRPLKNREQIGIMMSCLIVETISTH